MCWPLDVKNWLIGKDCDTVKDWRQEEKGMTEDEMVEWYHQLDGHEFGQDPGVGDGQGSLACCSPWGCKELNMTERLNWTELIIQPIALFWETLYRLIINQCYPLLIDSWILLIASLLSDVLRYYRFFLYIFSLRLEINNFFKKFWFLLIRTNCINGI